MNYLRVGKKPPRNVHHVHPTFYFKSLGGERYILITFTLFTMFTTFTGFRLQAQFMNVFDFKDIKSLPLPIVRQKLAHKLAKVKRN